MRNLIFWQAENGRRRGDGRKFTLAEALASTGLLVVVFGVTIAVTTSSPLLLVPGITYAVAVGLAYMVYRHYLNARSSATETAEAAETDAAFKMDVHPLLEAGWEDELALESPEWVDQPAATYFKVVGNRGICPRGVNQGDYVKVTASGAVVPNLCAAADSVLHMAARDDSEIREWCCPIYDHLLVFKKLD